MAYELSADKKQELEKLLKFVKNMESIVRTTPSAEQRIRVQKELSKYRQKISALIPGLDASRMTADQIRQELGGAVALDSSTTTGATQSGNGSSFGVLSKFDFGRASEHSSDPDINFLSGILHLIQDEYWPSIAESHCKLDFSSSAERDSVRQALDNIMRNLGVLMETIEEYAEADKQDFREQLLKMKNRQTRTFIYDANEALKKIRDFVSKLAENVVQGGGIVMNKDDSIKFNSRFEEATRLNGHSVQDAIQEFRDLLLESLEHLNLPQMKIRGDRNY